MGTRGLDDETRRSPEDERIARIIREETEAQHHRVSARKDGEIEKNIREEAEELNRQILTRINGEPEKIDWQKEMEKMEEKVRRRRAGEETHGQKAIREMEERVIRRRAGEE